MKQLWIVALLSGASFAQNGGTIPFPDVSREAGEVAEAPAKAQTQAAKTALLRQQAELLKQQTELLKQQNAALKARLAMPPEEPTLEYVVSVPVVLTKPTHVQAKSRLEALVNATHATVWSPEEWREFQTMACAKDSGAPRDFCEKPLITSKP